MSAEKNKPAPAAAPAAPAARKGRKPIPENETRADAFKRLATGRVNAALEDIRLVGQLASPNYEFTQAQIDAIFGTLNDALGETHEKFTAKVPTERSRFAL